MVIRSPIKTSVSAVVIALVSVLPMLLFYAYEPSVHLIDPELALGMSVFGIALISWFTQSVIRADWAEIAFTWLVIPLVSVFIVRVVIYPEWGAGPYPINVHPFAMVTAGLIGIGLAFGATYLAVRYEDELWPIIKYKLVFMAVILLMFATIVPIALVGQGVYSTSDTSITGIDPVFSCGEPGAYEDIFDDEECPLAHRFAVGIQTDGDPLRVVIETPSGVQHEYWFGQDELNQPTTTLFLRPYSSPFESPEVGTYTIWVESVWGNIITESTHELEHPSSASVTEISIVDAEAGLLDVTVEYTGEFQMRLDPDTAFQSELQLEFDEEFNYNGPGTDTVRATVIDEDGEAIALEPGTYDIDIIFDRTNDRQIYTLEYTG